VVSYIIWIAKLQGVKHHEIGYEVFESEEMKILMHHPASNVQGRRLCVMNRAILRMG